eukprot:4215107-Prymnesium_polylepis.1
MDAEARRDAYRTRSGKGGAASSKDQCEDTGARLQACPCRARPRASDKDCSDEAGRGGPALAAGGGLGWLLWHGLRDSLAHGAHGRYNAPGSATVRRTLERIQDEDQDLRVRQNFGRSRTLSHEDDLLVGLMLVEGWSQQTATDMLNAERAAQGLEPVSKHQIRDAEQRVELVRRRRRSTKAGSVDEESEWAQACLNQSVQWKDQLRRRELKRTRDSYTGPQGEQLKVGNNRVKLDTSDEWGLLGEAFEVKRGMWGGPAWKGTWPCKVVGYKQSYRWPDKGQVPTYFFECTKA